jgi:hypothetical protein
MFGKIFRLLCFCSYSAVLHVNAQDPVLSGNVSDKETGTALRDVNIMAIPLAGGKETGTTTLKDGAFQLRLPTPGAYVIRYSFIGYKTKKDTLQITKDFHVGQIRLKPEKKDLVPVNVEAEKTVFDDGSDKTSYSPDEKMMQSGASVIEFLQTVPSVNINDKGKITLRGNSKITVMIDGKLAGISSSNMQAILENLPASAIERMEIYDNPGAKMNAQGTGGIINIITKKGEGQGFSGSAGAAIGLREKANTTLYLTYRNKKISMYGTYGFRYGKFASYDTDTGQNRIPGVSEWNFNRRFEGRLIEGSHSGSAGLDWNPNEKNSINITGLGSFVYGVSKNSGRFSQFLDGEAPFDEFSRGVYRRENELNAEGALLWLRKFKKPKQQLETEVTYGYNAQRDLSELVRTRGTETDLRKTDRNQRYHFVSFRSDFTLPVSKNIRLETGVRYTGRFIENRFYSSRREDRFGFWLPDTFLINKFRYREHVTAFYAEYTHKINRWKYRLGFRGEPTFLRTELADGSFSADKFYFGWFPFAGLYYDINKTWETKLTFARRISRPKPGSLNPFTDFSDPLDLRFGNPDLNPEYLNTLEWAVQFKKGDYLFKSALFGRLYNNPYGRIRYLDTGSVVITTSLNYRGEQQAGLELIGAAKLFKALTLSANVNLYYSHIDATDIQPGLKNSLFGYEAKLSAAWFLPKIVSGLFVFNYRGPDILLQGNTKDTWRMDLSVRRSFFKDKLTLTFSVRDLFNTWFGYRETRAEDISRFTVSKNETRIIMAGIIFRFGKLKPAENSIEPDFPADENRNNEE